MRRGNFVGGVDFVALDKVSSVFVTVDVAAEATALKVESTVWEAFITLAGVVEAILVTVFAGVKHIY